MRFMSSLIAKVFGKDIPISSKVEINIHYGSNLHEDHFYKIAGYRGTFRLIQDWNMGPLGFSEDTFIRENIPKGYKHKVPKILRGTDATFDEICVQGWADTTA